MAYFGNNACKAWLNLNMSSGSINDDFNVSGVTDHEEGHFTVSWDTDFANDGYAVAAMSSNHESTNGDSFNVLSGRNLAADRTVGTLRFRCIRLRFDTGNIPQFKDSTDACIVAFGD